MREIVRMEKPKILSGSLVIVLRYLLELDSLSSGDFFFLISRNLPTVLAQAVDPTVPKSRMGCPFLAPVWNCVHLEVCCMAPSQFLRGLS